MLFMRRLSKQFFGPILLVIIIFGGVYLLHHVKFSGPPVESTINIAPTKPQDYILLGQKIDINSAGADVLETLPGVGLMTAMEIVKYRNLHGPFKSVDDLDNVPGIGPKTLEKIKPLMGCKL